MDCSARDAGSGRRRIAERQPVSARAAVNYVEPQQTRLQSFPRSSRKTGRRGHDSDEDSFTDSDEDDSGGDPFAAVNRSMQSPRADMRKNAAARNRAALLERRSMPSYLQHTGGELRPEWKRPWKDKPETTIDKLIARLEDNLSDLAGQIGTAEESLGTLQNKLAERLERDTANLQDFDRALEAANRQ